MKITILLTALLAVPALATPSLLEKRKGHKTKLVEKKTHDEPPPAPPEGVFEIVKYPSEVGELSAYLTQAKEGTKPGPAIIWITGGIPVARSGEYLWEKTKTRNEQSARIYRLKGVHMMFPHLRGRRGNPGQVEHFYGEVNDVISAFEFLSKQKHVDPKRIYLGGHSSGGTLALLVAASTDKFAGVISLGPTDTTYGKDGVVYEWNKKERDLRSPILHLTSINTPTIIAEGETGNNRALMSLKKANENKYVSVVSVDLANHFDVIHPFNILVAEAILKSKDGVLDLPMEKLKNSFWEYRKAPREASDLRELAELRSDGVDLTKSQTIVFYVYSDDSLKESSKATFKEKGFTFIDSEKIEEDDHYYHLHRFSKTLTPIKLEPLFAASESAEYLCRKADLDFGGWTIEEE